MDTQAIYSLFSRFRLERMRRFLTEYRPSSETTILDLGGFSAFWRHSGVDSQIIVLQLEGAEDLPAGTPANIRSIAGDGCDLREHADQSFDLVFSNSVIEHVGDLERQQSFAREALRVGRSVWVQTPAWEFPVEPHLLTPFIHWFPQSTYERLIPLSVWGLLRNAEERAAWSRHVRARLISAREMRAMFPGARLITERFCGLPKSHIAYLPAGDRRRS